MRLLIRCVAFEHTRLEKEKEKSNFNPVSISENTLKAHLTAQYDWQIVWILKSLPHTTRLLMLPLALRRLLKTYTRKVHKGMGNSMSHGCMGALHAGQG